MGRLFLIRHAEVMQDTKDAEAPRGITDYPLDARGIAETKLLAYLTKTLTPAKVYTSPLQRASKTASMIAKAHGVEVVELDHLLPWDMGELTGQPMEKVKPELVRLMTKAPDEVPKGGQSYQDWLDKWLPTFHIMLDEAEELYDRGYDLVAVTHSRNIRAARANLIAGGGNKVDPRVVIDMGADPPASVVPFLKLAGKKWVAFPAIPVDPSERKK